MVGEALELRGTARVLRPWRVLQTEYAMCRKSNLHACARERVALSYMFYKYANVGMLLPSAGGAAAAGSFAARSCAGRFGLQERTLNQSER